MAGHEETEFVVFCYLKDDWDSWRSNAADKDMFEDTWDEWWDVCREKVRQLRAEGVEPSLVKVSYEEFARHCRRKGVPNDSGARVAYAGSKARERRSST